MENVASIEHGLEVVALQRLGNNLRISGEPYGKDFSKEGYTTVAADINDSIKLLSSYLARRKQWVNELPNDKRAPYLAAQRSFVVIDSIKNPFESMYLKSRYTNYYLIGTYTEDRTRHERLRENSAILTPILRQLTSLSSKVLSRKMERRGITSGKNW